MGLSVAGQYKLVNTIHILQFILIIGAITVSIVRFALPNVTRTRNDTWILGVVRLLDPSPHLNKANDIVCIGCQIAGDYGLHGPYRACFLASQVEVFQGEHGAQHHRGRLLVRGIHYASDELQPMSCYRLHIDCH